MAEVALALLTVVLGGRVLAGAVAVFYVGFAGLVGRAILTDDVTSCGCFAGDESPPSVLHVAIDVGLAACAFLVARSGAPAISSMISGVGPGRVALTAASGVVDAGLIYLAMVKFPRGSHPLADWQETERTSPPAGVQA
jgi:hypothetical protein